MSGSKYASLPDIDTAPDVYETPDVPTQFTHDGGSDSETEIQRAGSPSTRRGEKAGTPQSENIDGDRLDTTEARRRFGEATLNGSSREENGRKLVSRRLPSTNSYSLNPKGGSDEKETNLERLRRLRSEVEELEEDVRREQSEDGVGGGGGGGSTSEEPTSATLNATGGNKGKKKEVSPAVILQQLQLLRGDLGKITKEGVLEGSGEKDESEGLSKKARATKELLDKLGETKVKAGDTVGDASATKVKKEDDVTVGALELRVSQVERVLGASEADVDESHPLPPPLIQTLSRLDHLLTLLTQPRHLDSISRRVKVLVSDLERLHESRRKLGDNRPLNVALSGGMTVAVPGTVDTKGSSTPTPTIGGSTSGLPKPITGGGAGGGETIPPDTLQKIDSLFSLLPRLDPLLPLTPRLLTRLRSLATLHSSAASFGEVLEGLKGEVERLGEGEKGMKEVLEGLEKSVGENEGKVRGNLEGLEGRLSELAMRMDKLGL